MISANEARHTITESKTYKERQKKETEARKIAVEKEYEKICKKIEKAVAKGYFGIDYRNICDENRARLIYLGYSIRERGVRTVFGGEVTYRITW